MQNIKEFNERELVGTVTLTRLTEDNLAFTFKNFDPNTGRELDDRVGDGKISEYMEEVLELQAEINELNAFIAKCQALTIINQ
jgi:hypothetical protein